MYLLSSYVEEGFLDYVCEKVKSNNRLLECDVL
jgi:hypothetical protein